MEEQQSSASKSNGIFILAIIALLAGLGVFAFLWSSKSSELSDCSKSNQEMEAQINEMNEMMSGYVGSMSNDLTKDLQEMLDTYDALMEKDKTKSDSINVQKQKIEELQEKVRRGNLTASELAKMKRENETLRRIMRSYVYQIDSLNTLNLKLRSDLDVTTNNLTSTTQERDQYKQSAEEASEKVKKGSKLSAYGFISTGLRSKLNNTMTETTRANNTIQIRSSFTIGANPITPSGRKAVYMQIIKPDGTTFQSRASNVVDTDRGSVAYSDKKDIDYNNEAIDVAVYYDLRGEDAPKGNYSVKIYCDGQLIGTDSFTLK